MNYMVFKNARPAGTKKFSSYEEARQYARKLIRKRYEGLARASTDTSNPMIGDYGYSVKRIA